MTSKNREQKSRIPLLASVGVVGVIAILGIGSMVRSFATSRSENESPVYKVRRGPLTISIIESGTIQAREREVIKSKVEGQATIIYLIPEGTIVEDGQLLVELEASRLQDDLVEQQIRVQNAEAAFIRARENLEVTKNQAKSDISRAKLDLTFADEDLKQYVDGQYPQELKEADSKITLGREELERATEKLKWSQRLYEEKYISQTELDADRLTHNRARLDHELTVASKKLLGEFTHKRQLAQLESDIEQAQMALERVQLRSGADIVQAGAELKANQAEFGQQKSKLAKVERQIVNTKIFAPRAGLVVYATSARASWRGNDSPLDEGQSVRERQELIYLPTADEMISELQIHESNLDKVKIGMPVRVTVDALKGRAFTGRVSKIAPLPNAFQMRINPDLKVYVTEVILDGKNSDLRTGMSCKAEIIIDRYEDAVYVPVQAIVREGNQSVAYVRNGRNVERKPVEIGLDNNRVVHVLKGLEENQDVLLTPPLSPARAPEEETFADATPTTGRSPESHAQSARPSSGPPDREASSPRHGNRQRGQSMRDGQGRDSERGQRGQRGEMSEEQRERMRKRFENMTPEDREAMRRRFQNMSSEDREAAGRQGGGSQEHRGQRGSSQGNRPQRDDG